MKDLFLDQSYGKLYEAIYRGECDVFEFQSALGTVNHLFIKRKVPYEIEGIAYYDLVTPFTYGGPVIEECSEENKWELLNDFQTAFQNYCEENNIVSEFVRFHPLLMNSLDFLHCYELDYVEDLHGIQVAGVRNPVGEAFSKEGNEKVLNAFKRGVDYEIYYGKDKIEDFNRFCFKVQHKSSDYSAMYFEGCKEVLQDQVLFIEAKFDGKVVGMTMCLLTNGILTTHLMVTDKMGDVMDAAFVMHYGLTVWAKSNGIELFHMAGNWINKSEKENKAFRNHFSELSDFKVCIGRKVWNEEVYRRLCEMANVGVYIDYFPAYRFWEN